ncbi:MAG: dephospho-CoA kinase [Castellaniella sp.]|uniref:dephospho-CoA kinase n=1 Tax=Castellaniella sp. TaxID=1955812 RepID=UPI0011FD892A|nr:dephospho-CoA kinase [Castellaniella sp.]TAN28194.1 MAG: dephospho-CoA kinase [Castellaniella sp.]
MFSIGLTGGIGSGKSQVADWLGQWGAAVIDTDLIAHELTAPGGGAMAAVRARFGNAAIRADGGMDRDWMRKQAFGDPAVRHELESIVHSLIEQTLRARAAQASGLYLVFVVPLLVESGRWHSQVDRVCVVDCDAETQIRRVQARSGLTRDTIERIMTAQASRENRLAAADDVILNDGTTDLDTLRARTRGFHDGWCGRAARCIAGHPTHE